MKPICPNCNREFDIFTNSNKVMGCECLFCKTLMVSVNDPSKSTIRKLKEVIDSEFGEGKRRNNE